MSSVAGHSLYNYSNDRMSTPLTLVCSSFIDLTLNLEPGDEVREVDVPGVSLVFGRSRKGLVLSYSRKETE